MKILHWFLPHKKNKFHPHALRPFGLAVFAIIFLTIPFLYNVTSAKQLQVLGYATNVTIGDLHAISNQERSNNGLGSLALNDTLSSAALAKANDMIAKNYWAHVSPDGTTPWAFMSAAGYQYATAGENLAKDFSQSSGVVAGWMASPAHRDNVINTSYQDVGYAVVNGVLQGSETTLVVAMYGSRASTPTAPAQPAPAQTPAAAPQPVESHPVSETPAAEPSVSQDTPAPTAPHPEATPQTNTQQPAQSHVTAAPRADEGHVVGITALAPVRAYQTLNWGQKASLLLLSTLALLFIMKHTLIWREQKRGFRHIWLRAHPLGQAAILVTILIVTAASGAGVIL